MVSWHGKAGWGMAPPEAWLLLSIWGIWVPCSLTADWVSAGWPVPWQLEGVWPWEVLGQMSGLWVAMFSSFSGTLWSEGWASILANCTTFRKVASLGTSAPWTPQLWWSLVQLEVPVVSKEGELCPVLWEEESHSECLAHLVYCGGLKACQICPRSRCAGWGIFVQCAQQKVGIF